jgi:hypothetical protein
VVADINTPIVDEQVVLGFNAIPRLTRGTNFDEIDICTDAVPLVCDVANAGHQSASHSVTGENVVPCPALPNIQILARRQIVSNPLQNGGHGWLRLLTWGSSESQQRKVVHQGERGVEKILGGPNILDCVIRTKRERPASVFDPRVDHLAPNPP